MSVQLPQECPRNLIQRIHSGLHTLQEAKFSTNSVFKATSFSLFLPAIAHFTVFLNKMVEILKLVLPYSAQQVASKRVSL